LSERPRSEHRAAGTVRTFAHRFAYVGLIVAAGALMMLGKADVVLVEKLRLRIVDATAPILDVLSRPVDVVTHTVEQVHDWMAIHDENARLREDRARLMQWQTIARQLEAENAALRQLLHFVPDPEVRFVTARVVADSGGAFAHSVLLGAGLRDGVGKGQPVVADQALVGRIAGVSERSARVLLITDLNSRIPVLVGSTRTRAILAGDNSDKPELVYLASEAVVSPGDRIITSGHAGVFPAGIPVGVVTSVGDGEIRVKPFVDRERLEYLRVIDYGLSGIIGETLEMVPKAPPKSAEPVAEPESRGGVEP
jgi:rod shape-determining protein MreC